MKWVNNKTFPYPVLVSSDGSAPADRDYVNREFQATMVPTENSDLTLTLKVSYLLKEESIVALIKQNKAKYATEIHCRSTYVRRLLKTGERSISVNFGKGELHDLVEVSSYVVCTEPVQNHTSANIHPEFGENPAFNFVPGDVLAMAHPEMFYVIPNFMKAMGSIFELEPSDMLGGFFSVDLENPKIRIIMNPSDADKFSAMQKNSRMWPSLLASVYMAATAEAVRCIANNEGDYSDRKWFRVIAQTMSNKNIQPAENMDFLKAAQELLEYPVNLMLSREESEK